MERDVKVLAGIIGSVYSNCSAPPLLYDWPMDVEERILPAAAVRYCRQGVTFLEAVTKILGVLDRKQGVSGQALKGSQNMLMNDAMALDISFAERGAEAAADPALEVLYRSLIAQLEPQ